MEITSFKKNHPKNAIGYVLAVHADGDTDDVFKQYVIQSVADSRRDAIGLGFVEKRADTWSLTADGREAVRTIVYRHDDVLSALQAIDAQSNQSTRFIDELPVMGAITRQALLEYPPTRILIDALDELAQSGQQQPSLATVAKTIAQRRPEFALKFFVASDARDDVRHGQSGDIAYERFEDGEIYSTHTTFQYKAMLYHVGILTERGNDTKSKLDPTKAEWALEDPMTRSVGE